ncbi:MAG: translesion DNA synthesis-associated protein ImuA [Rhodocyclaceae bacterium]|nr:translesion DNA synthesis-associated protein ImuA [Pseudomonadota bacterium]MDQ7973576.1 translesion DNA synthesis-associated protein ImuA [Rhodocyclaceae bacterium]MDQ8001688.1 translesion DNA synthesis-associated protein ImuA [Pseudomonadota bacterium]
MGQPSPDPFSSLLLPAEAGVWRADELGAADAPALPTGHPALDAQLPGGGWPVGALTEVLQAAPDAHVWSLLLPALAQAVARHPRARAPVVLIGAPHEPFGRALAAAGVPVEALLWVRAEAASARLWSCEQALRCADVAAVLAWLPQARVGELRRLQLAAARHEGLLFVFRPVSAAQGASPARLRLQVERTAEPGGMDVHILKRRGPPLAAPVTLPARSERMAALLAAARLRRRERQAWRTTRPEAMAGATVVRLDERRSSRPAASASTPAGDPHALAGPAVVA